ncbi:MAG: undecaprenyl-phosphate galactose phosphotransferase WbaP [Trueperaceae bacterium]
MRALSPTRSLPLMTNTASLLLGFGFSFLPSFTPFLALLVFFTDRRSLRRSDLLWLGATLLLALPLALAGDVTPALRDAAQLIGAWLLYRAFSSLRTTSASRLDPFLLGVGLLAGLAALVATAAFTQIEVVQTQARLSQALVWQGSPGLFGHTALTLGVLIAAVVPKGALRVTALLLSAGGILLSGSREAALAWLLVVVILQLFEPLRTIRGRAVEIGVLASMLLFTVGVGTDYGFARLGFLLDLTPTSSSTNLLHGTELPNGDWWFAQGVELEPAPATVQGAELTGYRVTKTEPEGWRRLQQVVPLQPGETYTLSAWIGATTPGARPGIQGWGDATEGGMVISAVLDGSVWSASATGLGTVLSSGVEDAGSGWRRTWVTFRYDGPESLPWWLGLTPDQGTGIGGWANFAGFQLEASPSVGPYVPGSATQGLDLTAARLPYWRSAVQAFLERPLLGRGTEPFPSYYLNNGGNLGRYYAVPNHTHSLPLQVLFERGIVGLAGLILLVVALARRAVATRDIAFLAGLLAVGIANLFDYSLFHAGVMYPLAAVAGWRATGGRAADGAGQQAARQATVRLALAGADLVAVVLGVAAAAWLGARTADAATWLSLVRSLPDTAVYAVLLWPAAAWREGLYPGYGLTPPLELRKQVHAALFAGLLLAVGSVFMSPTFALPPDLLLWTVLFTVILGPIGRALCKRLLLSFGLWGRPVVVIGEGKTARRIVAALKRSRLDGLQPVALFSNDLELQDRKEEVFVSRSIAAAVPWSSKHGVNHAIVAISSAPPGELLRALRGRDKAFQKIQFVPNLPGLPVLGVQAGSLDELLALEVRNELAIPLNRALKRVIDLIAVLVGGLLIAPVIGLIATAIKLDSPGPAFFFQRRIGRDGKHFRTWKFRTMVRDAEGFLAQQLRDQPALQAEWNANQKLQNDPRITRVGRFLRATSLDELPQLLNVLTGEMSLVGPRPIVDAEVPKYEETFELYTMVRPGITGYWQVSGRSETEYVRRVELDSFYVRNWSVWLDLVILVRTVGVVLRRRGAY